MVNSGRRRVARHLLPAAFCFGLTICCLLPVFCFAQAAPPQLTCSLAHISPRNRSLSVTCALSSPPAGTLRLRFTDQFAGLERLSERIFALKAKDASGASLPLEIGGAGRYRLSVRGREREVTFSYDLRLARPLDPAQYALASSLGPVAGCLLLADLLPRVCAEAEGDCREMAARVRLRILPPEGWQVATTEERRGEFFEIADAQRATFFLGRLRERALHVGGMRLQVAVAGPWDFADEQVAGLVEALAREQAALIGGKEQGDFLVTLAPFPLPLMGLRSSALTRGRTIILLLNPDADRARTLLHYQRHLAHELFHYYLPGAFQVRENFDWFWEGFTRYVALVTLLRLRLAGTRDYLDALGQEYDAYAFNPLRAHLSLIAASTDKFASPENYELVYRKGMLVAALYDLALRWQSGGRQSLMDVMRGLYVGYARSGREVGNREVLAELSTAGKFTRFVRDYVQGTTEIDLVKAVAPYGLVVERSPATRGRARLSVAPKLSGKQRALLAQLGY